MPVIAEKSRGFAGARDEWTEALLAELKTNDRNGYAGERLVSETDDVRVWFLRILPGERLPFKPHVLN
jgi:beta-alanine degradation protein BauB